MAELLLRTKLTKEEEKTIDECVNGMFENIEAFFKTPEGEQFAYDIIVRTIGPILVIEDYVDTDVVYAYVNRTVNDRYKEFLKVFFRSFDS